MQEKPKPVDNLRADAEKIITRAIAAVLPDAAVERALKGKTFLGRVYLVAAGKAAWQMAHAARACLQDNFCGGVVVTKYGHVKGEIANVACFEGGHPVPDENSLRGTDAALALTEDLTESDTVVFLLSGGGSALFEKPLLPLAELQDVTNQLLAAGADIVEINTIRKRLSAVKGGRFARHCAPAQVFAVVLSDILGDPLDMIASGPAYPDSSSCAQALDIAKRYGLRLSERAWALLAQETPKTLTNVETQITGSVRELCAAAAGAGGARRGPGRAAHSRVSASSAPDARSMLTAVSSATSAGKMRMTVFSPSRAPSVSAENTSVPVSTPQSPTPASSSGTVSGRPLPFSRPEKFSDATGILP